MGVSPQSRNLGLRRWRRRGEPHALLFYSFPRLPIERLLHSAHYVIIEELGFFTIRRIESKALVVNGKIALLAIKREVDDKNITAFWERVCRRVHGNVNTTNPATIFLVIYHVELMIEFRKTEFAVFLLSHFHWINISSIRSVSINITTWCSDIRCQIIAQLLHKSCRVDPVSPVCIAPVLVILLQVAEN